MTEPKDPAGRDGPLFGEAYRRADDIKRAETPAARRKAWARFVPSVLIAFAEGLLREWAMTGAGVFAGLMIVIGALSGDPIATVAFVGSGVLGLGLIVLAWLRLWSVGRQWIVSLGVLAVQIVAIILFGQRL